MFSKISVFGCYLLAYFYVIIGAFNDGMTSYYLAIPFMFFLAVELTLSIYRNSFLSLANGVCLGFAVLVIMSDTAAMRLIYPAVGEEIVLAQDGELDYGLYFPFSMLGKGDADKRRKLSSKPNAVDGSQVYSVKKGAKFLITHQHVSGHPNFSTQYIYQVDAYDDEFSSKFIKHAQMLPIDEDNLNEAYTSLPQDQLYIRKVPGDNEGILKFPDVEKKSVFLALGDIFLYLIVYLPLLILFGVMWVNTLRRRFKNE
jgi:hypothetical protein